MLYLRKAACPDSGSEGDSTAVCITLAGRTGAVVLHLDVNISSKLGNKGIPVKPGFCSHPRAAAPVYHSSLCERGVAREEPAHQSWHRQSHGQFKTHI